MDEIFFILSYNEVEIYLPVVIFVKFDVNVLGNLLPSDFILIKLLIFIFKSLIKKSYNSWLFSTKIDNKYESHVIYPISKL